MDYKLSDICHVSKTHWVLWVPKGFEVYRIECTHSVRCAQIGWTGSKGLMRAVTECNRRDLTRGEGQ